VFGNRTSAAIRFAAEGAAVVRLRRRRDCLDGVVSEIEAAVAAARAVAMDVTDDASVGAGVATAVAHFGRLDPAVNNAGARSDGDLIHQTGPEASGRR
jgi:NADP-dependent 3-hydroxy acid dehydrogenase YdfG